MVTIDGASGLSSCIACRECLRLSTKSIAGDAVTVLMEGLRGPGRSR
jgi:hypothetical protein